MDVWRPCDTKESVVAWSAAIERREGPTSLLFSRQNLPFQVRPSEQVANIRRGGYVLIEPDDVPRAVIIATGSEVPRAARNTVDDGNFAFAAGTPRPYGLQSSLLHDSRHRSCHVT